MPPYVLYARKSTESEDRQVLSIQSQINELRRIAAREGVAVDEVLTESKSAKAPGRPVFGDLMRRIGQGKVGGILCWKMDRLARNHFDTGQILQALADGQLERVITSDRTYTRDGNDRFMGTFEFATATKYIDDLRANILRGQRARVEKGWACGLPPLGYTNDVLTKTIVKDPERFDLVQRMWELLLTGATLPNEILRQANEEWGFRTRRHKRLGGKPLARSALYKIFGNPFYMGLIPRPNGQLLIGRHPPMVTREEFDRAQEILGRPGRARPIEHAFKYTGLIRCGSCGGFVTAEEHVKPSGRRYVYYRCSHNRRNTSRCTEPAVSETDLEQQLVAYLRRLTIPEAVLEFLRSRIDFSLEAERSRRQQVRTMLEGAIEGLRREEETLLSLRLRDLVDDATYAERRKAIRDRRVSMELRLEAAKVDADAVGTQILGTLEFAAKVASAYPNSTRVQKRMILEAVGLNYTLRARKVALEFKNPLRLVADAGSSLNFRSTVDDVRTWFENRTEYFRLPTLDVPAPAATMPSTP